MATQKKLAQFVGNEYLWRGKELVEVIGVVPKSRTKVEIKLIDKGEGWDKEKKKYLGVKKKHGWQRGQNYSYGEKDVAHIKELEKYIRDGGDD